MNEALRTVFGFEAFRPNQEEIIKNIMARRDVFAVMPTGGGKSLCYQLPSKMLEGTAVVISPLIALMKDQVDAARENGISAAFINSSMSQKEITDACISLKQCKTKLLYIAPERFAMPEFLQFLRGLTLSLFAIDEAHCISEWGHDFRPDYLGLSVIPNEFSDVPIAAFTATATSKVQEDIIGKLGLRSPFIVRASFNRSNLFYEVRPKTKVNLQILEFLQSRKGESGIIYRTTRDSVMEMAEFLSSHGIKALPYHAGLSSMERNNHQDAFSRDEIQVIVATIAFGMGIDKSNVRFVIHADLPKNIENYYQETGRAGRDSDPAHCLLFFSRGDIPKIRYFIDMMPDDIERTIAIEKLNKVVEYAEHAVCRRRRLLGFFGETYQEDNCRTCDICTGVVQRTDITKDAQIIMSAVSRTGQRFGAGHISDIVSGADTKKVWELRHNEIKTFGAGKDKNKQHWRFLINELLAQEMLIQEGHPYPILKLTPKGSDVLYGKAEAAAISRHTEPKTKHSSDTHSVEYDEALFVKLRLRRKEIASTNNVPPYIIFSDKTLREISCNLPESLQEMRRINGVGDQKLEQYGASFISVVREYLRENPSAQKADEHINDFPEQTRTKQSKSKKGETFEETYALFMGGMSLDDIAKYRKLATATIALHFDQLIRSGRDIDIDRLVDPVTRAEITEFFQSSDLSALGPVIEHFDGKVNYEEARIVRAWMQREKY
ncbi:MAG: DNA helicase RecQ [Nitrospirae bacterium]|nr:DNA helicase RecQ [Nitrospirota bacterium]